MKKQKDYAFTHFEAETLLAAIASMEKLGPVEFTFLSVEVDDATWNHDSAAEFMADYRRCGSRSMLMGRTKDRKAGLSVRTCGAHQLTPGGERAWGWETQIEVQAPTREAVETIFAVFEASLESAREVPSPPPPKPPPKPTIFIGHGRSPAWRDLKDHLHEHHGYPVEAFETGARAGHTIRDVLEGMLEKAALALLVMTAEDEQADGAMRARENVVHEAGLFQGKLGFRRGIIVLENGCNEFSNIHGIVQIRFSKGNIRETFGDVLATLKREFPG